MQHVISSDGTRVGFNRTADGPPLILVHGIASDHSRWGPLVERISPHFTTCAIDRRGRGSSGDADRYSIEREFEDIAAVAESLDGPVFLYGHSSGALYSLEAALRVPDLKKLVLYEPPIANDTEVTPTLLVEQIEQLIATGDHEAALVLFMHEVLKLSDEQIDVFRSQPSWAARVAAAPTFPREMRTVNEYEFQSVRFSELKIPVLLLSGSESPPVFREGIRTLHEALPNSRICELPGERHSADLTAPELVAEPLIEFLLD